MNRLSGSTPWQDANGVLALLELLADPVATKARLAELTAKANEAHQALIEMRDKAAESRKREVDIAVVEKRVNEQAASVKSAMQFLSQREATLKERVEAAETERQAQLKAFKAESENLAASRADHEKLVAVFDQDCIDRYAALDKREDALAAREGAVGKAEAALAAKQKDLASRMARLKEIAA